MLQPDEKFTRAQATEQKSWLRKTWIWGGSIIGLLLLGLGLALTDELPVQTPAIWAAFVNMLAKPLTQVVLVLLALLGIYPLAYIAYRQVYSKVHQTRLGEDFQLLGIYTEDEAQSKAEELYNIVYSNRQYLWFITLILLFSILILVVYGFIDQLDAIDLSKIGLDGTVRSLVFYAYLGAYVFSIQELVRRYNTEDLRPQVFSSILGRMLVSTVVVFVAARILLLIQPPEPSAFAPVTTQTAPVATATQEVASPAVTAEPGTSDEVETTPADGSAQGEGSAENTAPTSTTPSAMASTPASPNWWAAILAFFIGIFPKSGIQWLQNLARFSLNTLPPEVNALPVRNLQGISSLHEARLEEMGIDDVQNLAAVDIRKLLLITRFDTQEIINWIDQAILYAKVGNKIERFREQDIYTFHQMLQRLESVATSQSGATKLHELALSLNVTDEALDFLSKESDYPNYAFIKQYYLYAPQLAKERASEGRSRLSTLRRGDTREEVKDIERWSRKRDDSMAVLQDDPRDAEALNELGVAQYKLGENKKDFEEARDTLIRATDIDPYSTNTFSNLASVCVQLEDWDRAIHSATRAIELEPNNKDIKFAHFYLGQAYAAKNLTSMAENSFYKALDLDDHYGEVYFELGKLKNNSQAYQQAIDHFQLAYWLLSRRENINFWFEWGKAYLHCGSEVEKEHTGKELDFYHEAVEKLSEAIARKADPKFIGIRGLAYYKLGQLEPAIQDFEKSLKVIDAKAPEAIEYKYYLALAYWHSQRMEEAGRMFTQVKDAAKDAAKENDFYAVQAKIYLAQLEKMNKVEVANQPVGTAAEPPEGNAGQPGQPAETESGASEGNVGEPGQPSDTQAEPPQGNPG